MAHSCGQPGSQRSLLLCFAQHFSALHAGIEQHVYHNIPAWQWKPIMQLATGGLLLLLLRCGTSRWKGSQSTVGACPCAACGGQLEDPVHNVLERAGLADLRARYPAVLAAASTVAALDRKLPCRRFSSPRTLLSWLTSWC